MNNEDCRAKIIRLLEDDGGWMYGLDLIEQSEGVLKRGTVYVHLGNLIARGIVEVRIEKTPILHPGQEPRRLYRLVDLIA